MDPLGGVRYATQIEAAARAHGLDPRLLGAVAAQETGGPGSNSGANVVGDGGHGHGLFQIDDRYHAFARTASALDPAKNADYAAGMLESLLKSYGGDVRAALSAYNAGSPTATGTQTTWSDGQTLGYADSVLKHYAQIGGDAQEQLLAERGTEAAQVNGLRGLAQAAPQQLANAAAQGTAGAAQAPNALATPPVTPAPPLQGGSTGTGLMDPPLQIPAFTPNNWSPVTFTSEAGPSSAIGTMMGADNQQMASMVDPSSSLASSGVSDGADIAG
jgi:hypothetical protein